jgi:hypothetical protein
MTLHYKSAVLAQLFFFATFVFKIIYMNVKIINTQVCNTDGKLIV